VLGICNGFQVLCEAHLLAGCAAPEPRRCGSSRGRWTSSSPTPRRRSPHATHEGESLSIPVKHTTGRYYHPDPDSLGDQIRLPLRPGQNPNGSVGDIAGVSNESGNVVGLMPHPSTLSTLSPAPPTGGSCFESMALAVR